MTHHNGHWSRDPDEIEREVEDARASLRGTIDEIRDRLSPGQMLDQALDYARASGGADFTRNLGRSVRDNPLPILMIGAGIGWLMAADRHPRQPQVAIMDDPRLTGDRMAHGPAAETGIGSTVKHVADKIGAAVSGAYSGAASGVSSVASTVSSAASTVSSAASSAYEGASRAASGVAGTVTGAAESAYDRGERMMHGASEGVGRTGSYASDRAGRMMHGARESMSRTGAYASDYAGQAAESLDHMQERVRHGVQRTVEEQPLVLGVIGIALGAALGAMIPVSRRENEWFGEASDRVKDKAADLAREGYEQGKAVAGEALQEASRVVEERVSSADGQGEVRQAAAPGSAAGAGGTQTPGRRPGDTGGTSAPTGSDPRLAGAGERKTDGPTGGTHRM